MICKDLLCLSFVEHAGFKAVLEYTSPLFKMPSSDTITRKMEIKYELLKEKFALELEHVECYCITCDNWTDLANDTYIGVTIHYRKDSELVSGTLGCIPLKERHTSEYLLEKLKNVFKEFKVNIEKIFVMISDRAANIKKACIDLVGIKKWLPCIAHVLSSIIPDSLAEFPDLTSMVDKLKGIVKLIRQCGPATDELKRSQIAKGVSEGNTLKLIQSVPTRWDSTINMIERYFEIEPHLFTSMSKCSKPLDLMTREESCVMKDVLITMLPIREILKEIGGQKYPTASLIIPLISLLEKSYESISPNTDQGRAFKAKVSDNLNEQFKYIEQNKILAVSTILDPRFKRLYFKLPTAIVSTKNYIKLELSKLKSIRIKSSETVSTSVKQSTESSKKTNVWDLHDQLQRSKTRDQLSEDIELEQYLDLEEIQRFDDPLDYWLGVKKTFPNLSIMALNYLSLLATSIPSERLFSTAGKIRTETRNKLLPKHVNMLVFLSSRPDKDWGIVRVKKNK